MALALQGPEFEIKTGTQGMTGRDHPRSGKVSRGSQMIDVQLDQIRDKEKETSAASGESAGCQREASDIGYGFDGGPGIVRPLFVQTPWKRGKAFFMQDLSDSGRTEAEVAILEDFTDLIDRVIPLSQLDDSVSCGGFTGSGRGSTPRGGEETGMGIATELMAQDPEGSWGVTEFGSHRVGGPVIDEVGPHGFILPLPGVRGFEEELPALR